MEEIKKKKSNKGLVAIIIILLIALLGAIGYICYDKGVFDNLLNKEKPVPTEEPKQEETIDKDRISFVFSSVSYNDGDHDVLDLYGMKQDGSIVKLTSDLDIAYRAFDISDNTLYYVGKDDTIHSIILDNNFEDKKMNVKINKNYWNINVDGESIIIDGLNGDNHWFQEKYSFNNEKEKLSFISSGTDYFFQGKFYYTDRKTDSLNCYDFENSKTNVIAKEANIEIADGKYIIYSSNEKMYLYDIAKMQSSLIKNATSSAAVSLNLFAISDDIVYFINNNKIYKYENNNVSELLKLESDKDYHYDLLRINKDKFFISRQTYSQNGSGEYTLKFYVYDVKNNTIEETKQDYKALVYRSDMIYNK